MRVVEISRYGGPEVLVTAERPDPQAGPGQVLVRVHAATVNPADWLTRAGYLASLTPHLTPPLVPGWDLAGTVVTAGGGFAAGQRVAGTVPWFTTGAGTYAELVAADPSWLAPVPDAVDDVTAAAVALNGLTARQGLDLLALQPGQRLLVTGASGAVGGYAAQLAAHAGAQVVAVASAGDEAHVRSLGAHDLLPRLEPAALVTAVHGLVPGGADAVFDAVPVGPALVGAARDGGTFLTVLDTGVPAEERGVRPVKVGVVPDGAGLADLLQAVAQGRLTVRVVDTLPLEEAAKAHERAEAGGLRGKLVLTL